MIQWLKRKLEARRMARKVRRHLQAYGSICYCVDCSSPLFTADHRFWSANNLEVYVFICDACGKNSMFTYDLAPVPLLVVFASNLPNHGGPRVLAEVVVRN